MNISGELPRIIEQKSACADKQAFIFNPDR